MQQQQQQATQQSLVDQAGQLASSPMADPSKNPNLDVNQAAQANPDGARTDGAEGFEPPN